MPEISEQAPRTGSRWKQTAGATRVLLEEAEQQKAVEGGVTLGLWAGSGNHTRKQH